MQKEIGGKFGILFLVIAIILIGFIPQKRVVAENNPNPAGFYWEVMVDGEDGLHAEIWMDPAEQAVNAVGVFANFSTSTLALDKMEVNRDFCQLIIEAESIDGAVNIQCGLPDPGVNQKTKIADLDLKVIRSGWAEMKFEDSSMILANNGRGTNIIKSIEDKKILVGK